MLSRRGFLLSLGETRLADAAMDLQRARERGPGDGWVTDWNLANIAIRTGDIEKARTHLTNVSERAVDANGAAVAAFHVPGRPAHDSVVRISRAGLEQLLPLQRAIAEWLLANGEEARILAALAVCVESEDEDVRTVAGWVDSTVQGDAVKPPAACEG